LSDAWNWREVAPEEGTEQLHGSYFTATFVVTGGRECRFIWLMTIGGNHHGNNAFGISAWEIFGSLIE
jgi:hypothetical protein